MFDQLSDLHIIRPAFLLLLLPLCYCVYSFWNYKNSKVTRWHKFIDPHLLEHLLVANSAKTNNNWLLYLIILMAFVSVIALAGPSWKKIPQPVFKQQDALVIVLDLSLSMYAEDGTPSRLQQAKFKIKDVLAQRQQGLTALVVYSGEAYSVTPLSEDPQTIETLLNTLSPQIMPNFGSNIIAAFQQAQGLIDKAGLNKGRILLIADDIEAHEINSVSKMLTATTPLSVLAVGSEAGAAILLPDKSYLRNKNNQLVTTKSNITALRQLAKQHQGRFSQVTLDDSDINLLLQHSARNQVQQESKRNFDLWHDMGYYLVLFLIPCLLLLFRRGYILLLLCVLYLPSNQVYAFEMSNLFKNKAQRALEAYEAGNAQEHLPYFKSQLDKTNQESKKSARHHYNYANALAKSGKLEDAITHYERALAADSSFEDAQFNKQIVANILRKQQEKKDQQDQQSQQSADENKQSAQNKQQQTEKQNAQDQNQNQDQDQDQENSGSNSQEQQHEQNTPQAQSSQHQENEQEDNHKQAGQQAGDQQNDGQTESSESQEEQDTQQPSADDKTQEQEHMQNTDSTGNNKSIDEQEQERAVKQWLERVEDDPGRLLRNKFLYQYQMQQRLGKPQVNQDQEKFW